MSGDQQHSFNPVPGVNYPNQPQSDPSSDLSDPLTYWWGATLCPPELNDVSLAETVAIMMRYAALREVFVGCCIGIQGCYDGVCH